MADYSMANRKVAYTLGRGRAYIFDMSAPCGYMGAKYVQEFGPSSFCHVLSEWVHRGCVQEFGPRIFDMPLESRRGALP